MNSEKWKDTKLAKEFISRAIINAMQLPQSFFLKSERKKKTDLSTVLVSLKIHLIRKRREMISIDDSSLYTESKFWS